MRCDVAVTEMEAEQISVPLGVSMRCELAPQTAHALVVDCVQFRGVRPASQSVSVRTGTPVRAAIRRPPS
jgi:hypothetical protein